MKKSDLYQTANHDKEHILRVLRTAYAGQILSELNRLQGSADRDMIEGILENIHARLPEISLECDVSLLVTDCVHRAAGFGSTLPKNTSPGKTHNQSLPEIGRRIGQRHRRIAKYAVPVSCVLILIALLLLYLFPPF